MTDGTSIKIMRQEAHCRWGHLENLQVALTINKIRVRRVGYHIMRGFSEVKVQ
jgi:hypothetical protein